MNNGYPVEGAQRRRGHQPSSSSDFGDFLSAPFESSTAAKPHSAPKPSLPQSSRLDSSDLLMSFDEVNEANRRPSPCPFPAPQQVDLLTEEPQSAPEMPSGLPASAYGRLGSLDASPAKSRHTFSSFTGPSTFTGPSSPPRVSEAGSDIVFQAPQSRGKDDAASEFRRIRRMSEDHSGRRSSRSAERRPSSPPRARSIVDAFATSKLATRWKRSVLAPHASNQPHNEQDSPSRTAVPIDIDHSSPFASRDQIAGSYIAPDGAPGFRTQAPQSHFDDDDDWAGTRLEGRRDTTSAVLTVKDAQALRPCLPARQRIYDTWNLLFSLDQHGASLSTLYGQVEKYATEHKTAGNLLVVRDMDNHLFGVYLNEPIVKRDGTYYGSGEAFLFKFDANESRPRIFRWTGRNQYIALCETDFISFGGGGTSYGLLLDGTFSRNSSATSPAFQNEVLCGGPIFSERGQPFDCLGLEVWATS